MPQDPLTWSLSEGVRLTGGAGEGTMVKVWMGLQSEVSCGMSRWALRRDGRQQIRQQILATQWCI